MRPESESSLLIHLQYQNHGDAYPATTAELAVTRQRRRPATCTALIGPPYHESEEGRGAKRTTTRRIVGCRRRSEATLLDPASTASAPRRRRRRREMRARAADHLEALSLEIERKLQKVIPCPFLSAFRFLPPPPPLIVSFFHWFPGGLGWFVLVVSWPVSVDYWAFLGHLFGFFAINFGLEWGRCFFFVWICFFWINGFFRDCCSVGSFQCWRIYDFDLFSTYQLEKFGPVS